MPVITIENMIASFSVGPSMDLQKINEALLGVKPERINDHLVSIKLDHPRVACVLKDDGTIKLTGAHSLEEITQAIEQLQEKMKPADIVFPTFIEPMVEYVVASTSLESKVDLTRVKQQITDGTVEYEPQRSDWLHYTWFKHPNTVILVFASGTLVACGPSVDDVSQTLQHVTDTLMNVIGNK